MGKKPTHHVSVLNKSTDRWYKVGVGWINDKGTISIKLEPYVDLTLMTIGDLLVVGPIRNDKSESKGLPPTDAFKDAPIEDFGDDDIPV